MSTNPAGGVSSLSNVVASNQQNLPASTSFQRSATLAAAAKHHHSYNMSANEDQLNAIINFNLGLLEFHVLCFLYLN